MKKTKEKKPVILVYGIEKVISQPPGEDIETELCVLHFEPFRTDGSFQEYDGLILFQGIFEGFVRVRGGYPSSYEIICEADELQRRKKQYMLLKEKGGFICFLLRSNFVDSDARGDKRGTDLAKWALNHDSFYRENLSEQITTLRTVRNEFIDFIKHYGAAWTRFTCYNDALEMKEICRVGDKAAGIILCNREYFIPSLVPKSGQIEDFLKILADSLVSSHKKLSRDIFGWADEYRFEEEKRLLKKRQKLREETKKIDGKLLQFREYKKCICYGNELLRKSIIEIFRQGFGFKVDDTDEFREDLKIINNEGNPVVLLEVKGTNKGISRKDINQADNHREGAKVGKDFPSVLIVNTHIKKSSSLQDKYREVAQEQIEHGVKMNILIMRAIDLLNMLYLKEKGKLKRGNFLNILRRKSGWLEASRDTWQLRKR